MNIRHLGLYRQAICMTVAGLGALLASASVRADPAFPPATPESTP